MLKAAAGFISRAKDIAGECSDVRKRAPTVDVVNFAKPPFGARQGCQKTRREKYSEQLMGVLNRWPKTRNRRSEMWEFILKFKLPTGGENPEEWLDRLFEAGCDDATVGTGKHGSIALDFTRESVTADEAVHSAIENVMQAIPGAQLFEIRPDLANLTDLAEIVGCSRQNIRKYAAGEIKTVKVAFPEPVYTGEPSLWRLAEVLPWFQANTEIHPPKNFLDLTRVTSQKNIEVQQVRIRKATAAAVE